MKVRRAKTLWIAGIIAMAIALTMYLAWPGKSIYRTYVSRSGHYKLVFYKNTSRLPLPVGPGDSDGGSGSVELYDAKGKLLASAKISTVSAIAASEDLVWTDDSVSLPGDFRFNLPDGP